MPDNTVYRYTPQLKPDQKPGHIGYDQYIERVRERVLQQDWSGLPWQIVADEWGDSLHYSATASMVHAAHYLERCLGKGGTY